MGWGAVAFFGMLSVALQRKSCLLEHVQFFYTYFIMWSATEYATRKPYGNLTRLSPSRESLACKTRKYGRLSCNSGSSCALPDHILEVLDRNQSLLQTFKVWHHWTSVEDVAHVLFIDKADIYTSTKSVWTLPWDTLMEISSSINFLKINKPIS